MYKYVLLDIKILKNKILKNVNLLVNYMIIKIFIFIL